MEFRIDDEPIDYLSLTDIYLNYEPAILYSFAVVSGTPNKFCDIKMTVSGVLTTSGIFEFDNDTAETYSVYYICEDDGIYYFQGYII